MLSLFSQFKYYALALVFVVYSFGVWHVSSGYANNEFNKERLAAANEVIRIKDENAALATKLSSDVTAALAEYKKGQNAIKPSAPVYNDCLVDGSVRNEYKRKLEAQRRAIK